MLLKEFKNVGNKKMHLGEIYHGKLKYILRYIKDKTKHNILTIIRNYDVYLLLPPCIPIQVSRVYQLYLYCDFLTLFHFVL